eukprot:comp24178_c0_seq1/m.44254 comp24178_c0_seq1/g.44254  ORF comp24178_c0_seq1/g.44254 comp24178_c0_seq1/m.44254 type:complete len:1821 (-) comp24178_c0_seq1:643-6105(-)
MASEDGDSFGCAHNKNLPYADLLDGEAESIFEEVREGLATAIKLNELTPGAAFWVRRLNDFMSIHKYAIDRASLVQLCQLLYQMATIPDLDFTFQEKFASVLTKFLRKEEVLPSECMELPWRPLYDIMCKVYFPSIRSCVYVRKDRHGDAMYRLIDEARRFFPSSATEEILAELRPLLCLHDVSIFRAQGFLALFLPSKSRLGQQPQHHLWFKELLHMWSWVENMGTWDLQWLFLFDRLALDNLGHIDWTPHIPLLFTKFLHILNLPVGPSTAQAQPQRHRLPAACNALLPDVDRQATKFNLMCSLIVSLIQPNNVVLDELDKLLHAVESFYHPSNTGNWTLRLARLMSGLCFEFGNRLRREALPTCRYPQEARLGDAEKRRFVTIMKPILLMSLFAKSGTMVLMASQSLKYLAYIAPDIIFPDLLDRIYPALETLTETHQTVSALGCLAFVARPLLWRALYPDGALHLADLLTLSLPGIDPNDPLKTEATLKFYCAVLTCVPMVDCSSLNHDGLDEREVRVCESTAVFEEWAMQFLDRVFLVCEHYLEPVKRGRRTVTASIEANFVHSLRTTCGLFFSQLSPAIHEEASSRVFRFVTSKLLMKAIKPVGHIVNAASMTSPHTNLQRFLPFLCDRILDTATRNIEDADDEADKELVWDLQMVLQCVKLTGEHLLAFEPTLTSVLSHALASNNRTICKLGAKMLRNILRALTTIYPRDYRSVSTEQMNDPNRVHTRHWGESEDVTSINIDWHVPNREELACAHRLLHQFLEPSIDRLQQVVATLTKDTRKAMPSPEVSRQQYEIWRNLIIIRNIRVGCGTYMDASLEISPPDSRDILDWESSAGQVAERHSIVPMFKRMLPVHVPVDMDGIDVRRYDLSALLHSVQGHLLAVWEDDTKLLRLVAKTASAVLCPGSKDSSLLYARKRMYTASKSISSSQLERKRHVRMLLVTRAYIQHLARKSRNRLSGRYTPTHHLLIGDMVALSTNTYEDVQKKAQATLVSALRCYPGAKYDIFPTVLSYFDVPAGEEQNDRLAEAVKGAIVLLQSRVFMHLVTQSWAHMAGFIMALIKTQAIDKPAVQTLLSKLFIMYSLEFHTPAINMDITEACRQAAFNLDPVERHSTEKLQEGVQRLQERDTTNARLYAELNNDLVAKLESGTLHWRYELMVSSSLIFLLRPDQPAQPNVVRWFLKCMLSELSPMRKIAHKAMETILVHQKHAARGKTSIPVVPADKNSCPAITDHVYRTSSMPRTSEQWEQCLFVDKNYMGWSQYTTSISAYGAGDGVIRPDEHTEAERLVAESFTDEKFVAQLVAFMDQEDNAPSVEFIQGARQGDGFSENTAQMFKGVFRNCGIAAFRVLLPHLRRMCASTDKHSHRTASEIVGGAMRGCKHWNHTDTSELWGVLVPLLRETLDGLSNELAADWAACIHFCVFDRDPRRFYWLTDELFTMPLAGDAEESAATEGRRLQLWQTVLEELSWRGIEPSISLLQHLSGFLAHPYKLVRERIGRSLYIIFRNFWAPNARATPQAVVAEKFVSDAMQHILVESRTAAQENEEMDFVKYCNTVLSWLTITFHAGGAQNILPYFEHILPALFTMVDRGRNEQLLNLAKQCVAYASQTIYPVSHMEMIIDVVCAQARVLGWHGRISILNFMQVLVFRNLFHIDRGQLAKIVELLAQLMADDQLEVRELAARTLGGLVRCDKRCSSLGLQERFNLLAQTKVTRIKGQVQALRTPGFIQRHAGVLGMAALIEAYPYDVPPFMPSLLVDLGDHIADPVPISTTVKKTLSEFWRTHQDNWHNMKEKFTEDQLLMLTDLLISPSYYA